LRRVIDHIQTSCGMGALESPTIIYEDDAACVAQITITKHLCSKGGPTLATDIL
jgi:hypothetical protein